MNGHSNLTLSITDKVIQYQYTGTSTKTDNFNRETERVKRVWDLKSTGRNSDTLII
jgi:hypothetical protein